MLATGFSLGFPVTLTSEPTANVMIVPGTTYHVHAGVVRKCTAVMPISPAIIPTIVLRAVARRFQITIRKASTKLP